MLDTLTALRSWSVPGMHLIVSSRDEADIREELEETAEQIVEMRNEFVDQDIARFVAQHLQESRHLRRWVEYHELIEKALTTRAKGVFRWVECQFKALAACPESEDLLERLLNSLPETLDETYERMLNNISLGSRDYARQILSMLCCATRRLAATELIEGMAVQLGDPLRFNPKCCLKNMEAIQRVCPGFVELDANCRTEGTTVRLAHFSVREYLESDRISESAWFKIKLQDANTQMVCVCLIVLLQPASLNALHMTIRYKYQGPDGAAFYAYAAQNWPDHFRSGRADHRSRLLVVQFLSNASHCLGNWVHIWNEDYFQFGQLETLTPPPLYYAARLGLGFIVELLTDLQPGSYSSNTDEVIQQLINSNRDIDEQVTEYGYALQAASGEGHLEVVKQLIASHANVNATSRGRKTALQAALYNGHIEIAKLLLASNADVNAEPGHNGAALQVASAIRSIEMVKLLFDHNADVNVEAGHYGAALVDASSNGYEEVVRLLLANNANINAYGTYGTSLRVASDEGHVEVVKTLLAANADVNATTGNDRPALHSASSQGHVEIVKLLLANGADIDFSVPRYGTALLEASTHREIDVVKVLLANNADKDAEVDRGGTALQVAQIEGYEEIVQLLLDAGASHKPIGEEKGRTHE
ncbi:ankyrin repeat-containing domain protein [Dactylonectria macrodidyma]|uniref:Ankyrin repeat-containing domain protein n=1 Tax=Dactylonectria macrodidyma TaxID=307937 RepID=A0A9P9EAM6_9HYPO|nr:ankyrin repeat-containing domain protein [Dactylonectria macrodidyma]